MLMFGWMIICILISGMAYEAKSTVGTVTFGIVAILCCFAWLLDYLNGK